MPEPGDSAARDVVPDAENVVDADGGESTIRLEGQVAHDETVAAIDPLDLLHEAPVHSSTGDVELTNLELASSDPQETDNPLDQRKQVLTRILGSAGDALKGDSDAMRDLQTFVNLNIDAENKDRVLNNFDEALRNGDGSPAVVRSYMETVRALNGTTSEQLPEAERIDLSSLAAADAAPEEARSEPEAVETTADQTAFASLAGGQLESPAQTYAGLDGQLAELHASDSENWKRAVFQTPEEFQTLQDRGLTQHQLAPGTFITAVGKDGQVRMGMIELIDDKRQLSYFDSEGNKKQTRDLSEAFPGEIEKFYVTQGPASRPPETPDRVPESGEADGGEATPRDRTEDAEAYSRYEDPDGSDAPQDTSPERAADRTALSDLFGGDDHQKSLAAVDHFVDAGVTSFNVRTADGKEYTFRLENVPVNGRTNKQMTHLFAMENGGREKVMLRGVELQNPRDGMRFDRQRNPNGQYVRYDPTEDGRDSTPSRMSVLQGNMEGATITMTRDGKPVTGTFVKGADGQLTVRFDAPETPESQPEATENDQVARLSENPRAVLAELSDPEISPEQKLKIVGALGMGGVKELEVTDASGTTHKFQPVVRAMEGGVNIVELKSGDQTIIQGAVRGNQAFPIMEGENRLPYIVEANKGALDFDWTNADIKVTFQNGEETTIGRTPAESAPERTESAPDSRVATVPQLDDAGRQRLAALATDAGQQSYLENPPWKGTPLEEQFQTDRSRQVASTAAVSSILSRNGWDVQPTGSSVELAGQLDRMVESGQLTRTVISNPAQLKDLPPGAVIMGRAEAIQGGVEWPDGKRRYSLTSIKGEGDSAYHIENESGEHAGKWRSQGIADVMQPDIYSEYVVYMPKSADAPAETGPEQAVSQTGMGAVVNQALGLDLPADATNQQVVERLTALSGENGSGLVLREGQLANVINQARSGDILVTGSGDNTRIGMVVPKQDPTQGLRFAYIDGDSVAYLEDPNKVAEFFGNDLSAATRVYRRDSNQADMATYLNEKGLSFLDVDASNEQVEASLKAIADANQEFSRTSGKAGELEVKPGDVLSYGEGEQTRIAFVGEDNKFVIAQDGEFKTVDTVNEAFGLSDGDATINRYRIERGEAAEPQPEGASTGEAAFADYVKSLDLPGLTTPPRTYAELAQVLDQMANERQHYDRIVYSRSEGNRTIDSLKTNIATDGTRVKGALLVASGASGVRVARVGDDGKLVYYDNEGARKTTSDLDAAFGDLNPESINMYLEIPEPEASEQNLAQFMAADAAGNNLYGLRGLQQYNNNQPIETPAELDAALAARNAANRSDYIRRTPQRRQIGRGTPLETYDVITTVVPDGGGGQPFVCFWDGSQFLDTSGRPIGSTLDQVFPKSVFPDNHQFFINRLSRDAAQRERIFIRR